MKSQRSSTSTVGVSGFTLIELIMAMAACAVVLSAIYGVFSKAIHLRDNATERNKAARLRSYAVNLLRTDLNNAIVSGGALAASLTGSQTGGEGGFPGYLKFTTTTGRDSEKDGVADVQEVQYYIIPDKESSDRKVGVLVRTVDRALLAPTRERPVEEAILSGVGSMEVSFYDGQSWKDSWEVTEEDKTLPKGVRVRVLLASEKGSNETHLPMEVVVPWITQSAVEATGNGGQQ